MRLNQIWKHRYQQVFVVLIYVQLGGSLMRTLGGEKVGFRSRCSGNYLKGIYGNFTLYLRALIIPHSHTGAITAATSTTKERVWETSSRSALEGVEKLPFQPTNSPGDVLLLFPGQSVKWYFKFKVPPRPPTPPSPPPPPSKGMIVLCKLAAWILNRRCEVSQMSAHCSGSAMECGLISL